jgi:repressor LexA
MGSDGQYVARLQSYYAKHRVLPSYAGIGKLVGLRSKASVAGLVERLRAEGLVEKMPDKRLKPGPRFFDRPIAESVRAGPPDAATDAPPELLSVDRHLIPNPARSVLITVRGDSMIDAGIHPGDVVIVEKRTTAEPGQIVVAIVNSEFTVKRLVRERGQFALKPENKAYPMIRPKDGPEIFGVVVGQFRKYR